MRCHGAKKCLLAVTSVALVLMGLASAKDTRKGSSLSSPIVLSHVDLGGHYDTMALRQAQDHRYLYVRQTATADWRVFDLSDPARPTELSGISLPDFVGFGQASIENDTVIATGEQLTDTKLAVGDLNSNPAQTLTGVKQVIIDRPSDLIYVLSDDGLRILRVQPQVEAPDPNLYGG
jgi:hypothetical protein